jgi:hypothetical protein
VYRAFSSVDAKYLVIFSLLGKLAIVSVDVLCDRVLNGQPSRARVDLERKNRVIIANVHVSSICFCNVFGGEGEKGLDLCFCKLANVVTWRMNNRCITLID